MKRILMSITMLCACAFVLPTDTLADNAEHDMSVAITTPSIKMIPQGIELTVNDGEAHQFYIYSITGQMIKSVEVRETAVVDLPCGYYIVKCREWSKKIVVK